MIRLPALLGGLTFALMLIVPAHARADLIHWTYSWSNSPGTIKADSPGTGYVTLTNEPGHSATGNTDIVATNLQVHSTATTANPDVYTSKAYVLTLKLTDQASGASGTMVFTGKLNGTSTAGSANITNTFTSIGVPTLQLGDNLYVVLIGPYTPPGPPTDANSGSIGAHAIVIIRHLPEPGSLVLASIGLSLVGLTRRRSRAKNQSRMNTDRAVVRG